MAQEVLRARRARGISIRVATKYLAAEEAPESYKDVDEVLETCHAAGISRKVSLLGRVSVAAASGCTWGGRGAQGVPGDALLVSRTFEGCRLFAVNILLLRQVKGFHCQYLSQKSCMIIQTATAVQVVRLWPIAVVKG